MIIRTNVVTPTRPVKKKEAPAKVVEEKKIKKSVVKKPAEETKKIFEDEDLKIEDKEFSFED